MATVLEVVEALNNAAATADELTRLRAEIKLLQERNGEQADTVARLRAEVERKHKALELLVDVYDAMGAPGNGAAIKIARAALVAGGKGE